ncbi:MAG: release factor glutamine methyltransferase [Zhongshania sp.]|jgi:release factor glutamine methyltransferase
MMTVTAFSPLTIAAAMACRQQLLDSDSADLDVALLLCRCLDKPRSFLYTWPERELTASQAELFLQLLARRIVGEPIAHILGHRDFWSLPLAVSSASLIPRPDTECVVERALEILAGLSKPHILDLGTGTGAIALALASERPDAILQGLDFSAEAVALAQSNQQRLGFKHIEFQQSDWFAALDPLRQFDLIVSNPPYIDEQDPHLNQGDVRFEPRSALIAGNHGLADLQHIIDRAPSYLSTGASVLLEHGYNQAEQVRAAMLMRGFSKVASGQDYGGNDRMTWGQWYCD